MSQIAEILFDSMEAVRYVATYVDGRVDLHQRDGLVNASAPESDQYEELIVNPTLLGSGGSTPM